MRACSMASGGVFFIPDEIKRKECVKKTGNEKSETIPSLLMAKPAKQTKAQELRKAA